MTQSKNLSNFCARDFGVTKICNVYAYDLRNKEIKTGGHRSYKKMGAVPKVRIGDKTLFLSRSRTLKKFFAGYDSVTNTGNVSIYDLQKYDLKYGLSFHIKNKGRFKSQLYNAEYHFLSRSQILKYFFARFDDITEKGGISTYNLR